MVMAGYVVSSCTQMSGRGTRLFCDYTRAKLWNSINIYFTYWVSCFYVHIVVND